MAADISDQNTDFSFITGTFSQWYNKKPVSVLLVVLLGGGDQVQVLAWSVVGDDSLQVAGQSLHDGLHVLFQPLHDDVGQR